jgi:TM2 domain-containing membrane protein YozV
MNILKDVVRGATTQFGREFGRAGANMILKGANSYTITGTSDYIGRIKPSDSELVRAIKEVQKIKFATTNKANTSRLIELNDLMLSKIEFKGNDTLNQLADLKELIHQYDTKFDHGSALIDDDYKDKSIDYLEEKRTAFVELLNEFNSDLKAFVASHLNSAKQNRKNKKTATLLAFPILGSLGFHKFYFGKIGHGILYILFSFTFIPTLISFYEFISYSKMNEEKFDLKFSAEYAYYKQFS